MIIAGSSLAFKQVGQVIFWHKQFGNWMNKLLKDGTRCPVRSQRLLLLLPRVLINTTLSDISMNGPEMKIQCILAMAHFRRCLFHRRNVY